MGADDFAATWPSVYPHLNYADPAAAIAFLESAFGLRERVRMASDDGSVIVAKLETPGGGLVMIGTPSPDWVRSQLGNSARVHQPDPPPWPYTTHTVSVIVDDVDAHHAHARAAQATILMEPRDHPWGLRTYAAIDPEGHQWEFCQRLAPVSPEDWGATVVPTD